MHRHALFLGLFLFLSCSHQVQELRMKPVRFVAIRTPEGIKVELADPKELFAKATAYLRKQDYKNAAPRYRALLKYHPNDPLAGPALYNLGMCLAGMHEYREAEKVYAQYLLRKGLTPKDRCDGMEKQGDAMSGAGEHRAALKRMKSVAKTCVKTLIDRVRVAAKLAHEYNALGDPAMAMHTAAPAMKAWRLHRDEPGMRENYYAAMAYYEFAEAYAFMFRAIKLFLPLDRMEKDLMDKAQYFLSAQSALFNTIRVHNSYFGIKAGMEIGKLYEDFYHDLMRAEVPPQLNAEERKVYFEELKKQVRPLVQKAMIVYRENLRIGKYYRIPGKWLQEAKQRLKRLEHLLKKDKK